MQDMAIRLCVTVGCHRPSFIAEYIILPLMQHEPLDKITISLRSILELMFVTVARRMQTTTDEAKGIRRMMVSLETNSQESQLLEYIRRGNSALSLLKLEDRRHLFSKEIGKLLRISESSFGMQVPTYRSSMDGNAKDVSIGLNVMAWTLRTIPYILPDDFTLEHLVNMLAKYTGHMDALISTVAFRSLNNVLVGIPRTRDNVVQSLTARVLSIPDDNKEAILNGLRNIQTLLVNWLSSIDLPMEESTQCRAFAAATLEGKVLCFLCSTDPLIRQMAFDILGIIRTLDSALAKSKERAEMQPIQELYPFPASSPNDPSNAITE